MKTTASLVARLKDDPALRDAFLTDPLGTLSLEGYKLDPNDEADLMRMLSTTPRFSSQRPTTASLGVISGSPPASRKTEARS